MAVYFYMTLEYSPFFLHNYSEFTLSVQSFLQFYYKEVYFTPAKIFENAD